MFVAKMSHPEEDVKMRAMVLDAPRSPLRAADLAEPKIPLVLGHQVVAEVVKEERFRPGARVGLPWLGWTCGECRLCRGGRENLCLVTSAS
jgi:alcohol dehydrogenase, propanol-preferring